MLLSECNIFTALHAMQVRFSDENSVCPPVKRVQCDKTEERSVHFFIPYERTFNLVFWEEWVGGGDPCYLKFWVNRPLLERNRRFSTDIRYSASAVTPSEKSLINTNRKSTMRFSMSLRWSLYMALRPPKRGSKRKTPDFRLKSNFAWTKSATKFLCVKTVSGKVVRHSLA